MYSFSRDTVSTCFLYALWAIGTKTDLIKALGKINICLNNVATNASKKLTAECAAEIADLSDFLTTNTNNFTTELTNFFADAVNNWSHYGGSVSSAFIWPHVTSHH